VKIGDIATVGITDFAQGELWWYCLCRSSIRWDSRPRSNLNCVGCKNSFRSIFSLIWWNSVEFNDSEDNREKS
jgi:hypothetical protein